MKWREGLFLIVILTMNHAAHPAEKTQVIGRCASEKNCHPSVGSIFFNAHNLYCTAFLIAPHIIATNRHCVAQPVSAGKVLFPKTPHHAEEWIDLQDIVLQSAANVHHPKEDAQLDAKHNYYDYAFLKLAKPASRRPILIVDKGIPPNASWNIVTTLLTQDTRNQQIAVQQTIQCESSAGSFFNPFYLSSEFPFVFLKNCPVFSGNSGSPLLDDQGNARGMIYGGNASPLTLKSKVEKVAFANNFHCIPFPNRETLIKPECNAVDLSKNVFDAQNASENNAQKRTVIPLLQKMIERYPYFQWKNLPISHDDVPTPLKQAPNLFTLFPSCYKESEHWMRLAKKKWRPLPHYKRLEVETSFFSLIPYLDEDVRSNYELQSLASLHFSFKLNLWRMAERRPVYINVKSTPYLSQNFTRIRLLPCKTDTIEFIPLTSY